jgi:Restriction endonuclease NotI
MASRLVEFFGYAPLDAAAKFLIAERRCPFVNDKCTKPKSGGCTLQTKTADPVIICPNRLYAKDHAILADIARTAFGPQATLTRAADLHAARISGLLTGNEVAVFGKYWGSELKIPQPKDDDEESGDSFYIDYVMARIDKTGATAEFTAVEVQAIDTTNSYKEQSAALFSGRDLSEGTSPGWTNAGLNWANVSKRILPQLIYKGYVLRRERLCGKGMFFVCPSAVLKKIRRRLGTKMLEYPIASGTITFVPYDLGPYVAPGTTRELIKGETFTTTVEQLAYAFVSPVNLPKMGVYEEAIGAALIPRRPKLARKPSTP